MPALHAWFWLGLSGLIGLVLGDYFLFKAYAIISSRHRHADHDHCATDDGSHWLAAAWRKNDAVAYLRNVPDHGGIFLAIFSMPDNGRKIRLSYPVKGIHSMH